MKFMHAAGCLLLGLFLFVGVGRAANLALVDAGGGSLSTPVAHGDYLYVGTGVTLTTWDMSDPSHPVVASRTSRMPAPGPLRALAMVGDHLYAVWSNPGFKGGIIVYSLVDPARPLAIAEINDYVDSDFKNPTGLAASGNYVYLGDSENGLIVLDATNPLAPVNIGVVEGVHEFTLMGVYGGKLLTSGSSWIGGRVVHVIDLTNPAVPVEVGSTALNGDRVLRAVLTDGYAIGVGLDLMVYDLRDPQNISEVFNAEIDVATHAIRQGDMLYLIGASGIQVWDFTTPSAPTLLRTVAMDAFAPDQAIDTPFGPLVLTRLDRGLLLDVADPQNPTLAASFPLPFGVSVHAAGFDATHAYFAEEGYGLGVFDSFGLDWVGRYEADLPASLASRDMEDISVDSGRAYLAAWGFGVLIADLADPANPVELGRFEFPYASAIEAHGDRVYVASTTNGGFFKVLDVSNPAQPQELGSLVTSQTYDLTVRGHYAYLTDGANFGDGGLRIVDVANPAAPTVVGQDKSCSFADGIDVSADGNLAYVACASDSEGNNAFLIINTANKANPVIIGSIVLPGSKDLPDYNNAHSVVIDGEMAYVANEFGVDEIDIRDATAPVRIARHEIGYAVRKIERAPDGRVFAFAGEAGTFVFAKDSIFENGFD